MTLPEGFPGKFSYKSLEIGHLTSNTIGQYEAEDTNQMCIHVESLNKGIDDLKSN